MISVGEGDKSMRLWNMLTGQRQGNLEFGRALLAAVGASRWRGAEGRRIVWSDDGIEFAVAFERGVAVYGLDLEVRGIAKPSPQSKICEVRYLTRHGEQGNVLAVSTEDGRVLFYGTDLASLEPVDTGAAAVDSSTPQVFRPLAHLGPLPAAGTRGSRIKDFIVIRPYNTSGSSDEAEANADEEVDDIQVDVPETYHIVTATSEGSVKIWSLRVGELDAREQKKAMEVGELVGSYETGRRVTCLEGFMMEEEVDSEQTVSAGLKEPVVKGSAGTVVPPRSAMKKAKVMEVELVEEQEVHNDDEDDEFGGFSDDE